MTIPPAFHFPGVTYTPHRGGLSGALLFIGTFNSAPAFVVKRHTISHERLRWVHAIMQLAPEFLLKPIAVDSQTVIIHDGAAWDGLPWCRGQPTRTPNEAQFQAAFAALAQLHRAWPIEGELPFPGVARRLSLLRPFRGRGWADGAIQELISLEHRPIPVRPCLADGHAEHFLFENNTLVGVIDGAAIKLDHPAVDVARLAEDWDAGPAAATAAYLNSGGDPAVREDLVAMLRRTGTAAAYAYWQNRGGGGERAERLRRRLRIP
jgi:hypothetical protein